MIWKRILRPRVLHFASTLCNLVMDIRDCYRPELHYMRGPGPKSRTKHH